MFSNLFPALLNIYNSIPNYIDKSSSKMKTEMIQSATLVNESVDHIQDEALDGVTVVHADKTNLKRDSVNTIIGKA